MGADAPAALLGYGGALLMIVGGTLTATLCVLDPRSVVRVVFRRYEAHLEGEVRFLFMKGTSGARIARVQLAAVSVLAGAAVALGSIELGLVALGSTVIPHVVLHGRHRRRVEKIEDQLPSWLLLLANALKATPSLGQSIAATSRIVRAPIRDDLDLCMKEFQLGTPIDRAILAMSHRIGSPLVASALATMLVAQKTGGELSRTLEATASALREMQRLEGVVRTKTAEGKAQGWVLGTIPFVMVALVTYVDPAWFQPLTERLIGQVMLVVAGFLWIAAIFLARRILAVDV